jgi:hypothetical protein
MMRRKLFFLGMIIAFAAQAQLVLNNGVIINVTGGTSNGASTTVVLNNPPATPVSRLGTTTSQGIALESEWNRLQYNLDQGTTAITVPYISNTTGTWVPFPLTMRNITAGTRAPGSTGAVRFSSTHAGTLGSGWDNYNYRPSQVLNMCGAGACVNNSNSNNNSINAIDRFWIIEPVYYNSAAQRPAVTFDFTYIMEEANSNGGNSVSLSTLLQPQRFDTINTGTPVWGWNGFPSNAAELGINVPGAMTSTGVGNLTNVQVSAANFFPDWTLSSTQLPLPVELKSFQARCSGSKTLLEWVTATETNSAYYTIEKSDDGVHFHVLANQNAAGNSNVDLHYSYIDNTANNHPVYYRLSETDKNGAGKIFEMIYSAGCGLVAHDQVDLFAYDGEVVLDLALLTAQDLSVTGYDVTGRLVFKNNITADEGKSQYKMMPALSQGVYLFEVKAANTSIVKKILLEN